MRKNKIIMLPREVVEQVRGALAYVGVGNASENPNLAQSTCRQAVWKLDHALRAALEQTVAGIPESVLAGWKLVPVEPNCSMVLAGEQSLEQHDFLRLDSAYRAMLAAAPQPPALDQQQVDQEPYLYYDPNTGDTWTHESIIEGCCPPYGLIALYTKGTK